LGREILNVPIIGLHVVNLFQDGTGKREKGKGKREKGKGKREKGKGKNFKTKMGESKQRGLLASL